MCCARSRAPGERSFSPFISCATPPASATASCCSPKAASAAWARWRSYRRRLGKPQPIWRTSSLRSPETAVAHRAPMRPLLGKELWEVASGRALWTMLLILCPLLGYSFFQAVSLYDEASKAAAESPVLGSGLSPLDGELVPTFGGLYLAATLLFPFVRVRAGGHDNVWGAVGGRVLGRDGVEGGQEDGGFRCLGCCRPLRRLIACSLVGNRWASLPSRNARSRRWSSTLWPLGRRYRAVLGEHFRQRGHGGNHHPCLHPRLLGARLCARRPAGRARVDIAA